MAQAIKWGVLAGVALAGLMAAACVSPGTTEAAPDAEAAAEAIDCSAYAESRAPVAFYGMDRYMAGWEPTLSIVAEAGSVISVNIGQYY